MHDYNITILTVDDVPGNRRLYRAILDELGCSLAEAGSGEEAVALCRRWHDEGRLDCAMILLDVHLPGMNGFETARQIRAVPGFAHAPIVFVSAVYQREADAYLGYDVGAADYLVAPVVPQILRAKARVFMNLHRLRRDAEQHAGVLEDLNRQIELAYHELESFSYAAAHDLQAPLRRIATMAEALIDDGEVPGPDERESFLHRILANARDAQALVTDLLKLSRIARSALHRGDCDLSALVEDIARNLQSGDSDRRAEWAIMAGLHAQADSGLMQVALANLLDNAWKYTTRIDRPRIEFGRDACGAYYLRDNGIGFDPELAGDRLFQPFQRFHKSDDYAGTGIGLATVHRIIAKHGGRIWVKSAKNAGTTFWFTLDQPTRMPTGESLPGPHAGHDQAKVK